MNHPIIKRLNIPIDVKNIIYQYLCYNLWRERLNNINIQYKNKWKWTNNELFSTHICTNYIARRTTRSFYFLNHMDPVYRQDIYKLSCDKTCGMRIARVSKNYGHAKLYL